MTCFTQLSPAPGAGFLLYCDPLELSFDAQQFNRIQNPGVPIGISFFTPPVI
jgi:hypothetical protein